MRIQENDKRKTMTTLRQFLEMDISKTFIIPKLSDQYRLKRKLIISKFNFMNFRETEDKEGTEGRNLRSDESRGHKSLTDNNDWFIWAVSFTDRFWLDRVQSDTVRWRDQEDWGYMCHDLILVWTLDERKKIADWWSDEIIQDQNTNRA